MPASRKHDVTSPAALAMPTMSARFLHCLNQSANLDAQVGWWWGRLNTRTCSNKIPQCHLPKNFDIDEPYTFVFSPNFFNHNFFIIRGTWSWLDPINPSSTMTPATGSQFETHLVTANSSYLTTNPSATCWPYYPSATCWLYCHCEL